MLHYKDLVKVKEGFYKDEAALVDNAMQQVDEEKKPIEGKYTYLLKFMTGQQDWFTEEQLELLDKEVWMKEKKMEGRRVFDWLRDWIRGL